MAESYVVDASVVSKWFNRGEEFEKESYQLKRAWINDEIHLVAPSHLPFEVANSIWKNTNVGARRAVMLAKILVELSPQLNELSESVAGQAMSIARRKHLTFYDASYLALAKLLSLPLITADDEQARVASGYVRASHLSSFAGPS
jgi:predicted nucleic acid-binding protein